MHTESLKKDCLGFWAVSSVNGWSYRLSCWAASALCRQISKMDKPFQGLCIWKWLLFTWKKTAFHLEKDFNLCPWSPQGGRTPSLWWRAMTGVDHGAPRIAARLAVPRCRSWGCCPNPCRMSWWILLPVWISTSSPKSLLNSNSILNIFCELGHVQR